MDAPIPYTAPRFIHSHSWYSKVPALGATALASTAWPTANRAIYIPISIPFPYVVRRMFIATGATVNGANNVDLGIYSMAGGKAIVRLGSQVLTGTTTIKYFTPAEVLLSPGAYFFAVALDSTDTVQATAMPVNNQRMAGVYQEAGAFALPATMTIAAPATAILPLIGITSTSSGF